MDTMYANTMRQAAPKETFAECARTMMKRSEIMVTFEESSLIGIYADGGRSGVIADIEKALPYIDDADMAELCQRVIGKLRDMADDEFAKLELAED